MSDSAPAQRAAVVTGAASGIGNAIARRLLSQGWTVWGMDMQACALAGEARFHDIRCDVSSADSVHAAFAEVAKGTRQLDALVCCAGVVRVGLLEEISAQHVDAMLGVNVKGPWQCTYAALPLLREGASQADPHRVVVIGSVSGLRPKVGSGMYAASKAAIHVLAGVMAVELAESGITVNTIAPGTTQTPMIQQMTATVTKAPFKLSGVSPMGRVAQPDDIADAAMYLLGDSARYINGIVLPVDGGTRAAHK